MKTSSVTAMLLAMVTLVVVLAAASARADLLAFYPFDAGSVDDTSGNNRHGVINGAPEAKLTGGHDGGDYYYFNGYDPDDPNDPIDPVDLVKDYIRISGLDLNPFVSTAYKQWKMPQLTVGAWARTTDTSAILRSAVSADSNDFDRPNLGIDTRSAPPGTATWNASTGFGTPSRAFENTPVVTGTEGWVFLAAVYNGPAQLASLYVNDQRFDNFAIHSSCDAYTDIGGNETYSEMWRGDIDDVFFFNEALTPAQIASIRAGGRSVIEGWTSTTPPAGPRTVVQTWDFEEGNLDGFHIVPGSGIAFNNQPVTSTAGQYNHEGTYYIRTWAGNGDGPTGVAESDPFVLQPGAKIEALVNGGRFCWRTGWDPDTVINLGTANIGLTALQVERLVGVEGGVENWEVLRSATGLNSNDMMPISWDLSEYAGQTVRLRMYDLYVGGWGQVVVDYIVYSIPEPGCVTLLASAVLGLAAVAWRRRRP